MVFVLFKFKLIWFMFVLIDNANFRYPFPTRWGTLYNVNFSRGCHLREPSLYQVLNNVYPYWFNLHICFPAVRLLPVITTPFITIVRSFFLFLRQVQNKKVHPLHYQEHLYLGCWCHSLLIRTSAMAVKGFFPPLEKN